MNVLEHTRRTSLKGYVWLCRKCELKTFSLIGGRELDWRLTNYQTFFWLLFNLHGIQLKNVNTLELDRLGHLLSCLPYRRLIIEISNLREHIIITVHHN